MSFGREYDLLLGSLAETSEFLDDVLEYFQEDDERIRNFEEWKRQKESK